MLNQTNKLLRSVKKEQSAAVQHFFTQSVERQVAYQQFAKASDWDEQEQERNEQRQK